MPYVQKVKASLTEPRVAQLKKEDPQKYAKLPQAGAVIELEFDFKENGTEADKAFGVDAMNQARVFALSHPIASMIRDGLASGLAEGMTVEAVKKKVLESLKEWKPYSGPKRMSATEKEKKRLLGLPPEQRAREIEELKKLLSGMAV